MAGDVEGARKVLKILKENFTCPVCLETFRDARTLKCQHIFCRECLDKIKKNDLIVCPVCNGTTIVPPNGCQELPKLFLLSNLSSAFKEVAAVVRDCTFCERGHRAVSECKTCEEYLCSLCVITHDQLTASVDHNLVPISHSPNLKQSSLCWEHDGEEQKFVCMTCKEPLCGECLTYKHRGEDHEVIGEKRLRWKLVEKLQSFDDNMKHVDAIENEIKDNMRQINNSVDFTCQVILTHFSTLLEQCKLSLKSECSDLVHKPFRGAKEMIELQKMREHRTDLKPEDTSMEDCLQHIMEFSNAESLINSLFASNNPVDLQKTVRHVPGRVQMEEMIAFVQKCAGAIKTGTTEEKRPDLIVIEDGDYFVPQQGSVPVKDTGNVSAVECQQLCNQAYKLERSSSSDMQVDCDSQPASSQLITTQVEEADVTAANNIPNSSGALAWTISLEPAKKVKPELTSKQQGNALTLPRLMSPDIPSTSFMHVPLSVPPVDPKLTLESSVMNLITPLPHTSSTATSTAFQPPPVPLTPQVPPIPSPLPHSSMVATMPPPLLNSSVVPPMPPPPPHSPMIPSIPLVPPAPLLTVISSVIPNSIPPPPVLPSVAQHAPVAVSVIPKSIPISPPQPPSPPSVVPKPQLLVQEPTASPMPLAAHCSEAQDEGFRYSVYSTSPRPRKTLSLEKSGCCFICTCKHFVYCSDPLSGRIKCFDLSTGNIYPDLSLPWPASSRVNYLKGITTLEFRNGMHSLGVIDAKAKKLLFCMLDSPTKVTNNYIVSYPTNGTFHDPCGLSGNKKDKVFVSDGLANTIHVYSCSIKHSQSNAFVSLTPLRKISCPLQVQPSYLCFDPDYQILVVSGIHYDKPSQGAVIIFREDGTLLHQHTDGKQIGLKSPGGVAVNSTGQILLANPKERNMLFCDIDGTIIMKIGGDLSGSRKGASSQFGGASKPIDLAVTSDKQSLIVLNDFGGVKRIQIFDL